MARIHDTRESWLAGLAEAMRPKFAEVGLTIPEKLRVTCGWPSSGALAKKGGSRTIGECWHPECSKDGTTEVFISPVLAEVELVGATLCHELIHAGAPKAEHGPRFARWARTLGLEGKPTATTSGEGFRAWAMTLITSQGDYPHASVDMALKAKKADKNRQLKCKCEECGYTARTTRKWLEKAGAPLCPCNSMEMTPELPPVVEEEVADAA